MNLNKIVTTIILAAGAALLGATIVNAETPVEAKVKKLVEPRLGEGVKVDSVTKTPYSGLYEVRVGNDIMYTDENAKYLILGHVLDLQSHQDYTRARIDDINKIKFADLPLGSAIKSVRGNGKRVIAVFEDPNCGYCKRFRHTLQDMDNITVYTFTYNILAEDSASKSRNIWCSADRAKAWDDWMLNGRMAPEAPAKCSAPNEQILALGRKLGVTGTPTIFFADGTRIPSAIDAKALEEKLASIK